MTDEPKTDEPPQRDPRDDADPLIIDTLSERRLKFLQQTIAKGMTHAEIAHGLQIAGKYDLDPLIGEFWMRAIERKGGGREVLLMVGRDGLRKVAMKQGFIIDGDVVRERDRFVVTRNADRTRTIDHSYAPPAEPKSGVQPQTVAAGDRGPIIGAWAEVYDSDGKQRGYFYAPLDEYLPTSEAKLKWSPWGSQRSVMILAAAERTALGMATPLSGILAPGELDRADEQRQLGQGQGDGRMPDVELPPAVEQVIARAAELGHAGLADRQAAATAVDGQPEEFVEGWVDGANAQLDALEGTVEGEASEA